MTDTNQKEELEIIKESAITKLKNIRQNIDRGIRLIELDAPLFILSNEIRMIQWRALSAQANYEEFTEKKEERKVT